MKRIRIRISVVIFALIVFPSFSQTYNFEKLKKDEKLYYKIYETETMKELVVFSDSNLTKEVFRKIGYYFVFQEECQDLTEKKLLFSTLLRVGPNKDPSVELWYINGIEGYIKKMYSSGNISHCLDNTLSYLCLYDYDKSIKTPTIDIYRFPEMELIKTYVFDELANKAVDPDKAIIFKDTYFEVSLSNDAMDYKLVKIAIDEIKKAEERR